MKIKICGITMVQDAMYVAKAGGWAIGFVFFKGSPRYISPEKAGSIVEALRRNGIQRIKAVGVFVNSPLEEIENTITESKLDIVQLHGDEEAELCNRISVPVIKAIRPRTDNDLFGLEKPNNRNYILVDAFDEGISGGTGKLADWELASRVKEKGKVILSGGLNCTNVGRAIRSVRPYAIDLSSGVETAPGKKDHGKLMEIFEITRGALL